MSKPLFDWLSKRASGVLLHPTSLPGPNGIGTLGAEARQFLDFLAEAGFRHWQVCPLGPTGYGDSPYQCFSAFAGNPYLIDLRPWVEAGWLTPQDLAPLEALSASKVDYGKLWEIQPALLRKAHAAFLVKNSGGKENKEFAEFQKAQQHWLEPYAFFTALKTHFQGRAWTEWPLEFRDYQQAVKSGAATNLPDVARDIASHIWIQFQFHRQWNALHQDARNRGIELIGDIPIFVAMDSADVWSRPELFQLDAQLKATGVAGVPPDYFSADGQLWGNPLYAWEAHEAEGYQWWVARLRAAFAQCDLVRIDHFRGFEAYCKIPAHAKNARAYTWVPGPGLAFFEAIKAQLPDCRLIAEDLGVITDGVRDLLAATGLPGMAVLQFAFDGFENAYLPHNLHPNTVLYPGTHDNNTTVGWFAEQSAQTDDFVRKYLRIDGHEIAWDLLRTGLASVSRLFVVAMQDLLSLGGEARLNMPGAATGNWQWRMSLAQLQALRKQSSAYLRELNYIYGRLPG